jgi:pimeloyl-ACP methyl ester carboxylesterase
VIFYDQAGTGESSLPPNTTVRGDYPFLLNASYYSKEELPALIKALGLDKYHIVADSWGTMIAMQNATYKRDPKLLSLSLNGPIPRATDYVDVAWDPADDSIGTLPPYIKSHMKAIQESQEYESKEMQEIQMSVFHNNRRKCKRFKCHCFIIFILAMDCLPTVRYSHF